MVKVLHDSQPGLLCNIGNPVETHLKLKSRVISSVCNIRFNDTIVLTFYTEHDSITAVLCAKFQNDGAAGTHVMDEQVFVRFEF